MTSVERHELETVAKLLATEQGEVLLSYLKRISGFDQPIFDAAHNFDEKRARLIDGGRQLVIGLKQAPQQWKAMKERERDD